MEKRKSLVSARNRTQLPFPLPVIPTELFRLKILPVEVSTLATCRHNLLFCHAFLAASNAFSLLK
jgi:hypothetical protein